MRDWDGWYLSRTNTPWLIRPWCWIALGLFEFTSFLLLISKKNSLASLKISHWGVRSCPGCVKTGSSTYFWPLCLQCSQTSRLFLTRQKCFHSFQCCTDEKSSSAEIWDLVYLWSFHSQDRGRRRMQPRECFLTGTLSRGCWYILSEQNESGSQLDPHVSPAELKYRPARTELTVEMWLLILSVAEVIINYNYVHVSSCAQC